MPGTGHRIAVLATVSRTSRLTTGCDFNRSTKIVLRIDLRSLYILLPENICLSRAISYSRPICRFMAVLLPFEEFSRASTTVTLPAMFRNISPSNKSRRTVKWNIKESPARASQDLRNTNYARAAGGRTKGNNSAVDHANDRSKGEDGWWMDGSDVCVYMYNTA